MAKIDISIYDDVNDIPVVPLFWDDTNHHWVAHLGVSIGYHVENQKFYAEASDLRLKGYPNQLMLRFGHEEYAFQIGSVITSGEDIICVEYDGVEVDNKLVLFND